MIRSIDEKKENLKGGLKERKKFVLKMQVRNWLVCPKSVCNGKIFKLSFIL